MYSHETYHAMTSAAERIRIPITPAIPHEAALEMLEIGYDHMRQAHTSSTHLE